MAEGVLTGLGLSPGQVTKLPYRLQQKLVQFLRSWQADADLDAVLRALITRRPLLPFLDAQVEMFLNKGDFAEAEKALGCRKKRKASVLSMLLEARLLRAEGHLKSAQQIAVEAAQLTPNGASAWMLLGDLCLETRDYEGALSAYRHIHDISPDSRGYLLGMMSLQKAKGDWVAASAYAVRLRQSGDFESPLAVQYLRRLRDYFVASGEPNWVTDIETELAQRYAAEFAVLRESLTKEPGEGHETRPMPKDEGDPRIMHTLPTVSLDSFETVPISEQERDYARLAVNRLFGFSSLLPGQAEVISCALRGEDVLTVFPTGGGKSLCYQLPALLAETGVTLVISPLIALMKDQIDKLPEAQRAFVTTINSSLHGDELERRLQDIQRGRYRLVYAAPERLRQATFVHILRKTGVNRLVIDEVHCVSMWGHDFRPDYLYLPEARRELGNPPLLAMTATAAPRVRKDILQRLGHMRVIAGDVVRANLRLEVFGARNLREKVDRLIALCEGEAGAGIVYGDTRARCEELATVLRRRGISAAHYHAGIENRAKVQDDFMIGRTRIVVATVAFGMGIDKPDIRFIVHFHLPPSLEAYYQEAGRAGRDGQASRCVLFWAPSDRNTLTRRAHQNGLHVSFMEAVYAAIRSQLGKDSIGRVVVDDLRRELQAEEVAVRVAISVLEQAGLLQRGPDLPRSVSLRAVADDTRGDEAWRAFFGAGRLVRGQTVTRELLSLACQTGLDPQIVEDRLMAWRDAGLLSLRASARDLLLQLKPGAEHDWHRLTALLDEYDNVQHHRIAEMVAYANTHKCRHGHISAYLGGRVVEHCSMCDNCQSGTVRRATDRHSRANNKRDRPTSHPPRRAVSVGHPSLRQPEDTALSAADEELFQCLRAWRRNKAQEEAIPPFIIAHDTLLRRIAAARPRSAEQLQQVKGIGKHKLGKYGSELAKAVCSADKG